MRSALCIFLYLKRVVALGYAKSDVPEATNVKPVLLENLLSVAS